MTWWLLQAQAAAAEQFKRPENISSVCLVCKLLILLYQCGSQSFDFQGASEPAAASISSIDDVDEDVDDSGVEESDVKLVMDQAQVFHWLDLPLSLENLFWSCHLLMIMLLCTRDSLISAPGFSRQGNQSAEVQQKRSC